MAVSLATLQSRLEANVPAQNNIPSAAQYEQAIKDAVGDFSTRNPLRKLTTVDVVSGTATYTLPADFRQIIKLDDLVSREDNVIVSEGGLIPVSSDFRERSSVAGGQITFYPTPQYTASRYLWYAAAYITDASDVYQAMTAEVARVVLLKGQVIVLQLLANAVLGGAIRVRIGDEEFDKSKLGANYQTQARSMEEAYREAVRVMVGPVGMRPNYQW